ncbi:uncharacterized protein LOC135128324 [Zophobas morio]|uniref:uncharacterized protein LOC135128324 n=1 Tax=Zophobas morio TaxID=2755281 RepID=UPI003083678E
MNCLIPLLLLYYICGCNSPATAAIMSSLPNPGRKAGGCYESQFGHIRSNETVTIPDACVQIVCRPSGMITYTSCASVMDSANSNCYVSEPNYSKSFPECCPKFVCQEE